MGIQEKLQNINREYAHIGLDDKIEAAAKAQYGVLHFFYWWTNGDAIYCDENGFSAKGWQLEDNLNSNNNGKVMEAQNNLERINNFYLSAYSEELKKIERANAEKLIQLCEVYVFNNPKEQLNDVYAQFLLDDNGDNPDGNSWIVDNIGGAGTSVNRRVGWAIDDYARDSESRNVDGNWCGFPSLGEAFALDKEVAIQIAIESLRANYRAESRL
jgi:hypothetical protein